MKYYLNNGSILQEAERINYNNTYAFIVIKKVPKKKYEQILLGVQNVIHNQLLYSKKIDCIVGVGTIIISFA